MASISINSSVRSPSSTYRSQAPSSSCALPGIHVASRALSNLSDEAGVFAKSTPSIRKDISGIFGDVSSFSFSRAQLRTPPDVRMRLDQLKKAHEERERRTEQIFADMRERNRRRRNKKKSAAAEKEAADAEAEAVAAVPDYSKEGEEISGEATLSELLGSVPEDLLAMASYEPEKYCGKKAKEYFRKKYLKANRDFAVFMKDEELPEEV